MIPKFSILAALSSTDGIEIDSDSIFDVYSIAPGQQTVRISDGFALTSALPDLPCLVLVGFKEEDIPFLEKFRAHFSALPGHIQPDIIILPQEPSWEALLAGAFYGLEYFLTEQARYAANLSAGQAALRRENERLLTRLSQMDTILADSGLALERRVFEAKPVKALAAAVLTAQNSVHGLSQLLPASTQGLARIELHVAHGDADADGVLELSLRCPEMQTTLAIWRVGLSMLPDGWVAFGLPRAIEGPAMSAVLGLRVGGELRRFRLSSAAQQPIVRYQLTGPDGAAMSSAPLAMRLFEAPAGMPVCHATETIMPVSLPGDGGAEPARLTRNLRLEACNVAFLPDRGGIHGTPSAHRIVARNGEIDLPPNGSLVLRGCLEPGTGKVRVTIRRSSANLAAWRVRMAVVADGASSSHSGGLAGLADALAVSGWFDLLPNTMRTLVLHLTPPSPVTASLVLHLHADTVLEEGSDAALTAISVEAP